MRDGDRVRAADGFGMVELMLAIAILVVGLMGFISAILSSQLLTRVNRENDIASGAIVTTVEEFRASCETDFVATLAAYQNREKNDPPELHGLGSNTKITTWIVTNERILTPPMDLNGDGEENTNVPLEDMAAAVLIVRVTWKSISGGRQLEYTSILTKGEFK